MSIKADPPVTLVEKNAQRRKTTEVANAYLNFLYTEDAQRIIAKHFFRPTSQTAATTASFPTLALFTIEEVFDGWAKAQAIHFADGGIFDQITRP
jgi:sulfate transport system substrate-binding protein